MLIAPLGRSSRQKERDHTVREAVSQSLHAGQTRAGGAGSGGLDVAAPQGVGMELDGVSLLGKLGFALGFSGLGGPDYLFPSEGESEVAPRAFWELS